MNGCPTAVPILSLSQGSWRDAGRENGECGGFGRGLPVSGGIRPSAGWLSALQQELRGGQSAVSRAQHSCKADSMFRKATFRDLRDRPTSSGQLLGISRVEALRQSRLVILAIGPMLRS